MYLQWKINRRSYIAYQLAATAVTLNDLEHFAAFYTISTGSVFARFLCIRELLVLQSFLS